MKVVKGNLMRRERQLVVQLTSNEATELLNHLVGTGPEGNKQLESAMLKLAEALRSADRPSEA